MELENNQKVLYNFYGEECKSKNPEIPSTTSDLIRTRKAVYEKNQSRYKRIKKNDRDLFLRTKHDLKEAKKRDLKSAKVEAVNKIKILKKTLKELRSVNDLKSAVKFEIKIISEKISENAKYLDSSYKWLKKTNDSQKEKEDDFKNLQKQCKEKHNELMHIMRALKVINSSASDKKLTDKETIFVSKNKEMINEIKVALNEKINSNGDKRKKIEANIKAKIDKIESIYYAKVKKIKLKTRMDTSLEEASFNQKYLDSSKRNKEQRDSHIDWIKDMKNELNESTETIKALKKDEKYAVNLEIRKLKVVRQSEAKAYALHDFFGKLFDKANFVNANVDNFKTNELKIHKKLVALLKEESLYKISIIEGVADKDKNKLKEITRSKNKIFKEYSILEREFNKSILENSVDDEDRKKRKMILSFHFGFLGRFEYLRVLRKKYLAKKDIEIGKVQKVNSYEGDFLLGKSTAYTEYADNWVAELDKLNSERIYSGIGIINSKHSGDGEKSSKKEFVSKKIEINDKWSLEKKDLHSRLKAGTITRKAYKHKLAEYKIYRKEEINEAKFANLTNVDKSVYKSFKLRYWGLKKIWKKVYDSKVVENRKRTPIEIFKGARWVALLINLVLPGSSEILFFKKYKKGAIMLIIAALVYWLFIPFIFGINSQKFGGILGLIDMGASKHDWFAGITPDARYYLLGGIISIFFLVGLAILCISSAITAFKTAKVMEHGVRPMGWIHTRRWLSNQGFPWMISLPGWIIILFIVLTPVLTSMLISFTNMGFNHEPPGRTVDWVGLEQYGKWWIFKDAGMAKSLGRVLSWTAIWTLLSSSLVIALGTIVAVIVNQKRIKFKKFWRLIYIIPWAIPAFVTIMFLKSAFQSGEDALMNNVLMKLGVINDPVEWLGKIWTVRIILILIQGWLGHSYIFLLVTGNMQSIPKDVYEASSIDGAKNNDMFRFITVPILLSSIAPLLISQFAFNFNNFTIIALFSGGGPAFKDPTPFLEGGTDILISWIYKLTTGVAQIDGNMAFSSAMTMLAAVISVGVASYGFAKSAAFRRF